MTPTVPAEPAGAVDRAGLRERLAGPAVMLVAGEASGDLHGATLARALRALAPSCSLYGMGGRHMADAGVELVEDVTRAAVVGGTEAVRKLPRLYRAFRALRDAIRSRRPDALVVIDFPDFNLRLAKVARRAGVPVVYFIPPQVWAWRAGRLRTIRRRIALVLSVLPFEAAMYRHAGVRVEFVGHPVLDALAGAPTRAAARETLGVPGHATLVGLLPGSRREEVLRILPLLRDAAARIAAARPDVRFAAGLAPTVDCRAVARGFGGGPSVDLARDGAHGVIRAADVVIAASGTVTLEAALLGTPTVVVYRLSRLTETMGRLLVRVPWISLANLVLGRAVVPELYQAAATVERVVAETLRLLDEPAAADAQRRAFRELAREVGEPGVGERAARWVLAAATAR